MSSNVFTNCIDIKYQTPMMSVITIMLEAHDYLQPINKTSFLMKFTNKILMMFE